MPRTRAEIVKSEDRMLPFKVVFTKDGETVAERPVATHAGGRRLIESLLPLLQKHEDS